MTTTDPWQMIFDKAGDLADSLLHEQPKSKVDAMDMEEQVVSTVQKIATGEVDPRKDWSVIIRSVRKESSIDERIGEHFEIALRQAVYVRILFEHHMQKIKGYFTETSQPGMLMKVGEEMLDAFACAEQHATAWRLLKAVRDKSLRSQSGNQVKAEKKEEREVLLRSLIEPSLNRRRPEGGWRNHVIASQEVAEDVAAICKSCSIDISMNKDQIFEKVHQIILKESRFRKAFNETAEKPLDEPVKVRRVDWQVKFNEEE